MIVFISEGVLTFVVVAVVSLDMFAVRLVDELLEVMEIQDRIDGLCLSQYQQKYQVLH